MGRMLERAKGFAGSFGMTVRIEARYSEGMELD